VYNADIADIWCQNMSEVAARGIALEFGKSPQLRTFSEPVEVPSVSSRALFVVYSAKIGGGKTQALLRACKSIQSMVRNHERSPEWLILVDEYRSAFSLTEQLLRPSSGRGRPLESVVFYCDKSLDRWSVTEKSKFQDELKSAIDFLSQLAPAESANFDPPGDSSSDRRLQLARERRDQLLREEDWLDAPKVHIQQGGKLNSQGVNNTASRLRRRGELIGAWNGREFLHPVFQFDSDTGRLMPEMKTLLDVLPKDRSGWRQALWLFQSHGKLDGARPADVFQKNPAGVIEAALSDFELNDERW
jgi:hypothetical protein